jgi:hypothetical protein
MYLNTTLYIHVYIYIYIRKSGTSQKVDDDTCLLQVPQVEEYSDVPVGSVSKKIEVCPFIMNVHMVQPDRYV